MQVQTREATSRGGLRKLREEGKVPGVIYGKGLDRPTPVALDGKELMAILRSHPHAVIDVDIPGAGSHPVMMSELQRDPISNKIVHIDFHRVDMNEKIHTSARLDVRGESPGEKAGGMLQMVQHEVEIECYPRDIPDAVYVDIGSLELGENLTIADVQFPEGVKPTQDPETVIIAVLAPQKERTEDEVEAMEDKAEEDRKHSEAAKAVETDV